jgi:NADH:ubiquinone oxidoreductase subunit 5 (subunit L)/multisubunit Na+/H+ antiporter MnhA subunit
MVGAATAIFAATIGLAQNDIKKVLAYSTVSQLGYMFLAAGWARTRRRSSTSAPTPSSRRCSSSARAR